MALKLILAIALLGLPSRIFAQCPASAAIQLCNATLDSGSSLGSPFTNVVAISGTNPVVPPTTINSTLTDTSFSATGVRILRITAPGFDNRSGGAATNDSYHGAIDSHYLAMSIDDSTFIIQDQYGTNYVMAFTPSTFQTAKIPCSFDPTTGNIGQMGNCRTIDSAGTGQKYLIFNDGASPASNIYQGDNPYSWRHANYLWVSENVDAAGVKIYELDLSPTISNAANPPTVLNSGNPIVTPYSSCLAGGTSTSLAMQSMKVDPGEIYINGRLGTSLGSSFAFYYNQNTTNCYTMTDGFNILTNGSGSTPAVFYESDGVTPWGTSPTSSAGFHSAEVSYEGNYALFILPSNWDNDGTHCNADCLFIWQIGTTKVIMPDREDGHGAVQWTSFTKYRATSGGIYAVEAFPNSAPSLANLQVLAAWSPGTGQDAHFDANPQTSTSQSQYGCGTTFNGSTFSTPGSTESLTQPMDNEIFCYNNSGSLWRVAHDHTAGLVASNGGADFEGSQGYANTSRDGKYMLFGSEWGGGLLNSSGTTCVSWSTCRTDAFVIELIPFINGNGGSVISSGTKIGAGAKFK